MNKWMLNITWRATYCGYNRFFCSSFPFCVARGKKTPNCDEWNKAKQKNRYSGREAGYSRRRGLSGISCDVWNHKTLIHHQTTQLLSRTTRRRTEWDHSAVWESQDIWPLRGRAVRARRSFPQMGGEGGQAGGVHVNVMEVGGFRGQSQNTYFCLSINREIM